MIVNICACCALPQALTRRAPRRFSLLPRRGAHTSCCVRRATLAPIFFLMPARIALSLCATQFCRAAASLHRCCGTVSACLSPLFFHVCCLFAAPRVRAHARSHDALCTSFLHFLSFPPAPPPATLTARVPLPPAARALFALPHAFFRACCTCRQCRSASAWHRRALA